MQREIGVRARTETAAAESAPPSIKPNSASRRWRPDLAAGSYGVSSPMPFRFNPAQPLNLCCPPDVRSRFRPQNKTKYPRGPMQRVMGGKALTETAAAESAPPSIKPNSASRRWRPDLPAGTYGVSSPRPFRFNPPQPLNLCCPPDVRARFRPPNKTK